MLKRKFTSVAACLAGAVLASAPAHAGESLSFSYGPLIRSLKISSLKQFAKDGKVAEDLAFFLQLTTAKQQEQFRESLSRRAPVDPMIVSRFFSSEIGESVLEKLGKGITLTRGGNGQYAIRSALIGAAFGKDGLTLLNVLQNLPTNLQIHGERVLGATKAAERALAATETVATTLRQLTAKEAASQAAVDYASLPDPRKPGPYQVNKVVWNLVDQSRNRKFYVDVYLPTGKASQEDRTSIPVIIFSHGLSSRPEDYEEALRHLASHGFLVAAPQHPGSDAIWLKEMLQGLHRNIYHLNEFIDRPKDISFVIDELSRRNQPEFKGKLDLNKVGIAGHSFGGYTALAVAGATIDFANLKQECERDYGALDVALLLQCGALALPRSPYVLRDQRVQAAFAANPVNRAIFGPKGLANIAIPVAIASGSYDPAAPPAMEQAASFTWLTTPSKYWLMVEGQAHVNFTKIDPGIETAIESATNLTLPSQGLISSYINAITVPFFTSYIQNKNTYRPFLRSSYAENLSKGERFKLDFISGASSPDVTAAIEEFKKTHR
jgi:predicted dienelactone hydrolase